MNGKQFHIGGLLRGHIETSIPGYQEIFRQSNRRDGDHAPRGRQQSSEPYATFDSANGKITKRLRRFKRRLHDQDRQSPVPEGLDVQELVFAAESEVPRW